MELDSNPTLTEQQRRIIARLASGWSVSLAAKSERIHRNTIGNWSRTNAAFARELEFAASEQRRCWQDEAVQRAPLAMQAIGECITDPKTSPSVRLRAATYIIDMAADPEPKAFKAFSRPASKTEAIDSQTPTTVEPAPETDTPAPALEHSAVQRTKIEKTAQNAQLPFRAAPQPGRNQPCPCGSGMKFKRCCIAKAA
jgi:hypothetical protein